MFPALLDHPKWTMLHMGQIPSVPISHSVHIHPFLATTAYPMWFLLIFLLIDPVLYGFLLSIIHGSPCALVLSLYTVTSFLGVTISCFRASHRKGRFYSRSRVPSVDEIIRCITTDAVLMAKVNRSAYSYHSCWFISLTYIVSVLVNVCTIRSAVKFA